MAGGCVEYLTKPFSPIELVELVGRAGGMSSRNAPNAASGRSPRWGPDPLPTGPERTRLPSRYTRGSVLPIVPVQPKHVSDYAEAAGDEAVERLRAVADPLRGLRVLHVSSTAFGGGVAELLHTQVPLMNDLGVETSWALIEGSDAFFVVTKAIHNALQGAETQLDEEMRTTYIERIRANAPSFARLRRHDHPRPAARRDPPGARGDRPQGRWIWRFHTTCPAVPTVWEFVEPAVNRFDAAIFTAEEYVQPGVMGPVKAFIPRRSTRSAPRTRR